MKKTIRVIVPILLAIAVLVCTGWYLFRYDRGFTRDMLVSFARYSERNGNHGLATWFYNRAYAQASGGDSVAIELAQQYAASGNFTKAEYTLTNAIADGGGVDVYIALCKTYVQQDKLLDAVNMLNNVTNPEIKEKLDALRPKSPTVSPEPGFYSQYISVTLESDGVIYASKDGNFPTVSEAPYATPIALSDGENLIHAIAVAENGLVSTSSINQYTIGGVVEKVTFADAAVEAEIRKILNVGDNTELFTNDIWTITDFTVPTDAKSYADLKHMVYLEKLTIQDGVSGQIEYLSGMSALKTLHIQNTTLTQEDLNIIAPLPQLKQLTLKNTGLSGIAPLSAAVNLEELDISENTLRSLDALKAMTQLKTLDVSHNAIIDISALTTCTALTKLNLASNTITSLAPVCGLSGLTEIDVSTNLIADLGDIGKLTALTKLNASHNALISLSSIGGCTKLSDLDVSFNSLTEIDGLSGMDALMYLNFSSNAVTALPAFSSGSQLVSINGSNNQLSSLDGLGGLGSLNTVDMDYNAGISDISALKDCPVLIRVNVYGTNVKEITGFTDEAVEINYNPV